MKIVFRIMAITLIAVLPLIACTPQGGNTPVVEVAGFSASVTADAGNDRNISDSGSDGSESVALDGSGSTGDIASYVWRLDGLSIATGQTPTVSLPVGVNNITLTITGVDGSTDTDTVIITIVEGVAPTDTPTPTPTNTPIPTDTPTPTATNTPIPTNTLTPTATPAGLQFPDIGNCERPYSDDSIINIKIDPATNGIHPDSNLLINNVFKGTNATAEWINTNPQQKVPIYLVDNNTPLVTVNLTNSYRDSVVQVPNTKTGTLTSVSEVLDVRAAGQPQQLPIPPGASPALKGDQELLVINIDNGLEFGMRGVEDNGDGTYDALTAYEYHVSFDGVPPKNFQFRGADGTSLSLIPRRCEIDAAVAGWQANDTDNDHVPHALSFETVSPLDPLFAIQQGRLPWIPPWTDSDGFGTNFNDVPEGARMGIDPAITRSQINTACDGNLFCVVWVRTMQEYGAFIIDYSNIHPISRVEGDTTADWAGNGYDVPDSLQDIPQNWFYIEDWQWREGVATQFTSP